MKNFERFDHTADLGLRIYGSSLHGLFENAGLALFDVLVDTASIRPLQERRFELRRDTVEELLVEWLGSLLYAFDTERLLLRRFSVSIDAAGHALRAGALGEAAVPERHAIKAEVKAVTYHGLSVRLEKGIWQATVILDV